MKTTWIAWAIVMTSLLIAHSPGAPNNRQPGDADDWSQLNASMHKMHMAMGAIERSGDDDVDFVRLMLPHHQGAIDMAKVQLLHGKDSQIRRLAQEIITDQQLEIELMQRWLKAHVTGESKENGKSDTTPKKDK
jgi:uncharacterized protein (DUF305 family)